MVHTRDLRQFLAGREDFFTHSVCRVDVVLGYELPNLFNNRK